MLLSPPLRSLIFKCVKFINLPIFSNPFYFLNSLLLLISSVSIYFCFLISLCFFGVRNQKKMENLNLALVSSPKPLLLGHFSARDATATDVFRRKPFSFGRVFIVPPLTRYRVSALSPNHVTRAAPKSHQNPISGIWFFFWNCLFFVWLFSYIFIFFFVWEYCNLFLLNLCLAEKRATGLWLVLWNVCFWSWSDSCSEYDGIAVFWIELNILVLLSLDWKHRAV